MITSVSNLFGFSTTVANIRATVLGQSPIREGLCNSFVQAFDFSSSYGATIYQQVKNNSNIQNTPGFNIGSTYDSIEQQFYNILNTSFPNESIQNKKNLALAANALVFGYYVYNNINLSDFVNLMGQLMYYVSTVINNSPIFGVNNSSNVITPFTSSVIQTLLNSNYTQVIENMSGAPRNSPIEVVNYNWYETQNIFSNPNLQLMKDIENQYYYISGQLIYQGDESNLPNCIEIPLTINTLTGTINSTYFLNQPCVDQTQYIGPVTGVSFYREFNDGPFSSGDFTADVQQQYIEFDQSVLSGYQYQSNAKILYSFLTGSDSGYLPVAFPYVYTDANGIYNLDQEYINIPETYECSQVYSSMHIGSNWQRIRCQRDIHGNCINCEETNLTGFKFATLELDYQNWYRKYSYVKTNPPTSIDRLLARALNILPYSYISEPNTDNNLITVNSSINQPYLGYPQLTGQNALPTIAFFQTFSSPTFNVEPSLAIYPAIGTSYNGTNTGSDRTYEISSNLIFSGISSINPPIGSTGVKVLPFGVVITSSGNTDDISKQFFGMGDNLGNQFTILETLNYNAGYAYTGIVLSGSGILENIILYNNNTDTAYPILGSQYQYIDLISGYSNGNGNQYVITQMYAQDNSGNLISYYYLDNRNLPLDLQVSENELVSFCPLPDVFENNLQYNRISGTQIVENYLPRFSSGAYSLETETFLYPNASLADSLYKSKINGFPLRIKFVLNIREETVRELYSKFFITSNGSISDIPYYVNVIRPNSNGQIDNNILPTMRTIFVPDNSYYSFQYNFNNFGMDTNNDSFQYTADLSMVDNNWSPYISRYFYQNIGNPTLFKQFNQTNFSATNYFTPSGRNSIIYNNENNPFDQGVRLTGNGGKQSVWFTGTGNNNSFNFYQEIPMGNGLFHYYKPLQITGYLLYTPPYFDLSSGQGYINNAIQEAFSLMVNESTNAGPMNCNVSNDGGCAVVEGAYYQNIHGITGFIPEGVDPIFLQYMGGRSGGYLVQQEGGYHPEGIIGDLWNNFSFQRYGMLGCSQFSPCCPITRWAHYDNSLVLISSNPTATNLFLRALSYNPFIMPISGFNKFIGSETYAYNLDNNSGPLNLKFSGDYATFDLKTYMPIRNISGAYFYDPTGLIIGPFDRDMELGVLGSNQIYTNANLYCNNNQLTDPSGFGGCDINAQIYSQGALNSGIIPNKNGRDANFTIFAVIPKGGYATFNLSGLNSGQIGFGNVTGVSGIQLNYSSVSLRPRKLINLSLYDPNIHYGEEGWINPRCFINNGMEQKFSFNTSQFEDLTSQIFTFTTYSQSGQLFPIPNLDFTGLANVDQYGNFIYPSTATVEQYWKNYAIKNNQTIIVSGWREGSRMSFQFSDIEVEYDQMPYQIHSLYNPSGNCIVTGEMGYVCQAEASIFSAGVIIQDNTPPIPDGINTYNPSYFSDILTRLPFLTGISGNAIIPVLPAPSTMIQRQNVPMISGGQSYNKLLNYPPYDYNKYDWQAYSDLETLNPGETLEAQLPDDPISFVKSSLQFSASQGQPLPNGKNNPIIDQIYDVSGAYQLYDSIATDALINSGKCITQLRGVKVRIQQSQDLSGLLAPLGTSLTMIKNGIT